MAIGEPGRGADAEFMLCLSFAAVLLIHLNIINLPLGKTAYRLADVVVQDGLRTILAQGRTACNRIVSNGGGVKRLFCIQHLSQEAKIRSECYRDPLSDPPAPLCGAKPQLRIWGLFLGNLSSYVEPRAK